MNIRSLLFVPGDSERKLARGKDSGADVLILDLEDAVSVDRLPVARMMVRDYLAAHAGTRTQQLWVRINPLATPHALLDLAVVMAGHPDGIVLPKGTPDDAVTLGHYLSALEACQGQEMGSTCILPVSTEVPQALFALAGHAAVGPRLAGLTWGAEDLSTALGAASNREADGELEFTYRLARSMCLLAAANAGVPAIDTLSADFRDLDALRRDVQRARRAGFSGKIAIHPDQVQAINEGFTPDATERAHAQHIVDAFAAAGGAGTVQLDGRMLDRPHLTQALRLLGQV